MSTGSEPAATRPTLLHANSQLPAGRAPPNWPPASAAALSSSSPSPSSSFSSSASSSDIRQPASSQSDINSSDLSVSARPLARIIINTQPTHTHALTPAPRSTSLPFALMGQAFSKSPTSSTPAPPPSSPSTAVRGLNAAVAGGIKLKRAFAGRRKKSEDISKMERTRSRDDILLQQEQELHHQQRIEVSPSFSSSPAQVTYSASFQAAVPRGTKHITQLASQVFNVAGKRSKSPLQQNQTPPPLPPKTDVAKVHLRPPPVRTAIDNRSSIIPISPGISSAVNYMRMGEEQRDQEKKQGVEPTNKQERKEPESEPEKVVEKENSTEKGELKDSWRKSDSTIGHHTIRPGTVSNRSSRPVSMAESLQSNHTIVPINKRLSALVTDADFGMPEEDDSDRTMADGNSTAVTHDNTTPTVEVQQASPTPSIKVKNRRSMSLNITSHTVFTKPKLSPPPASTSATELKHPSHSISEGMYLPPPMSPSLSREAPTLTRSTASATGFIGPSSPGTQSTGNNIRGKLAAWTATTNISAPSSSSSHGGHSNNPYTTFPPPPIHHQTSDRHERSLPALPPGPSLRQTAISMTSGFAPAAGLAKRAVEKMGRAWGGISSSSSNSNYSGYSSSSSANTGTAPSSYSGNASHKHSHHLNTQYSQENKSHGDELARTISNQSSSGGIHYMERDKKGKLRRTPNAPSISSSIAPSTTSSTSIPDSSAFMDMSPGPVLGKRLRGPLKMKNGSATASRGVVFGRDLRSVVKDTGVNVGKPRAWGGRWKNWDGDDESGVEDGDKRETSGRRGSVRRGQLKALEERKLPALVVRCAQHLLIWGVQEEGLFRVSGRPFHVSKLRAEFDTGADFDMTECTPGDLDPHAVASVFKAFLRELPEPILTQTLLPYFEAAMNQESANNAAEPAAPRTSVSKGPGLPSGPRGNGLPLPAMRKPPSLSTLAMPTFTGMKPPSKSLLDAFHVLIKQLPEENRDLIRTVTELIKATARESKETKMPLSNLLLVFCPSLNMNPPLLRVLCEGEGIWEEEDPVLDIKREESPLPETMGKNEDDGDEDEFSDARDGTEDDGERESLLSESVGRTSEDVPRSLDASSEAMQHEPFSPAFSPAYVDTDSSSSFSPPSGAHIRSASAATSSLRDDGSSYTSTSDNQDNPSRHYSDVHSHSMSPPLLTSSAESLDTTSITSSGHPSFSHLPIPVVDADLYEKKVCHPLQQRPSGPIIAEASPMGLSPTTPRRPVISNPIPITGPIQFPSSASDSVHTPLLPLTLEKRRSIPVLSLPNFSPVSSPDSPSARAKRLKKPSLHLLFSKKSTSSLSSPVSGGRVASSPSSGRPTISSPYLQAPRSASDSSISTPRSAVTAPQSSTFTLPPTIDTPIESSSLRLGMGLGIDVIQTPPSPAKQDLASSNNQAPRSATPASRPLPVPPASLPRSASTTSLLHGQTPIADLYHRAASPSPSLMSKSETLLVSPLGSQASLVASHLRPSPTRSRGASTSSVASSNHLGLLDDEQPDEDWTRSVLLAADVDGGWSVQQLA